MVTLTPARYRRSFPASPFRALDQLEDELRRLPSFFTEGELEEFGWAPAVDVVEKGEEFLLTAELPGLAREDVEVEIEDDVLRLRGEKEETRQEETGGERTYRISERTFGAFSRAFTLPRSVDPEEIRAEFDHGVLTIHMPKREVARGRRIPVEG